MTSHHKDHDHQHEARKAAEEAMDEGLAAIYGETRDDLATLERGGSRVTRILMRVVIGLAAAAVLAYSAFFVYVKFFAGEAADPLTLAVEVPSELVSGTETDITIRYTNTGRVPLAALAIDVNVPSALTASSAVPMPTDEANLVWNVGSIAAGEEGAIVLSGIWIAAVPSSTSVQALATYRPANFNADFDAVATAGVTTLASTLRVAMTGPEEARPGEALTYTMAVENTSAMAVTDVVAEMELPTGFFVASSTPPLVAGAEPRWDIADLAAGATQEIVLVGSFAADVSDVQQLAATAAITVDGGERVQGEASAFTEVANGTAGDVTLDPGDPLRITLGYENTGESDMADVSFLVDFQAEGKIPISWSEASLDGGRLTADGIRFDAATIGTLVPNDNKLKNLIFPVRDELVTGDSQTWTVVVHATVGGVTISSQPLTVTLNSDTSFTAQSRYYTEDGAPVGEGPLPPSVGETTSYQIVWSVTNALHALDDVRVSATLPPSAEWEGTTNADLGSLSYDAATRTVSWDIAGLQAAAGEAIATFMVTTTPENDDVGEFVKLLSGSAFRATDSETGSSIQLTADTLTTECEGDALVEGKGYVEE
ncbi:DUF11 domain-containing protein [Candidatus Uhrbacteria bacterium]|nr:DUF11 domain-containing protein [Candidatus Uhrbacteria bacterium]